MVVVIPMLLALMMQPLMEWYALARRVIQTPVQVRPWSAQVMLTFWMNMCVLKYLLYSIQIAAKLTTVDAIIMLLARMIAIQMLLNAHATLGIPTQVLSQM